MSNRLARSVLFFITLYWTCVVGVEAASRRSSPSSPYFATHRSKQHRDIYGFPIIVEGESTDASIPSKIYLVDSASGYKYVVRRETQSQEAASPSQPLASASYQRDRVNISRAQMRGVLCLTFYRFTGQRIWVGNFARHWPPQ